MIEETGKSRQGAQFTMTVPKGERENKKTTKSAKCRN